MRNYRSTFLAIYIGLMNGILLGLILKFIEHITHIGVYTLLLNVDFIPVIGTVQWSEPIEFLFHVLISIIISIAFVYIAQRLHLGPSFWKLLVLSFLLSLPTFGLYFILSELAIKEVPLWNDWQAFVYWSIGHLIYVWVLALMYKKLS